jgi:putative solute:sodium symporter small subunit
LRESGQEVWWRRSGRLAGGFLATIAALAVAPVLLAPLFGARSFLGMPMPFALFALVLPVASVVAIFWFARRQIALDHRHDVTGDPS